MRRLSRTIPVLLLLFACRAPAEPVVTLVTIGPGDAIWEKFGHNMLRVEDPDRGFDGCFNWGVFDDSKPNFIWNFVQGRMLYTTTLWRSGPPLEEYRRQNRRVTFQRLRLSPTQTADLIARCVDNVRNDPDYRYDYFKDNCSTRVRDRLDSALGGALAGANAGVPASPTTFRRETLRLMRDDFWLGLGIDFALGPNADKPLDRWALGFLPATVAEMAGPYADAATEPWPSTRPPPPAAPRTTWPWLLGAGLAGAGVMLAALRPGVWPRVIGRLTVYVWWLLAGIGGAFMIYVWTATDHTAGYANQNLWHFSPLAWPALALHLVRQRGAVLWFTRAMAGMAAVGVVVWVVGRAAGGPVAQANGNFVLLTLPLNLAAAWATRPALTKTAASDEVSA